MAVRGSRERSVPISCARWRRDSIYSSCKAWSPRRARPWAWSGTAGFWAERVVGCPCRGEMEALDVGVQPRQPTGRFSLGGDHWRAPLTNRGVLGEANSRALEAPAGCVGALLPPLRLTRRMNESRGDRNRPNSLLFGSLNRSSLFASTWNPLEALSASDTLQLFVL